MERYVSGKLKRPRKDLRGRLENEVKKRWQPQIRAKARKKASSTTAWSSPPAPASGSASGTTDDARIRDITQALPPQWADRLFTAHEQGANEQQLQQIAADGLAQMYFRANNSRVHGLGVEWSAPTSSGSTSSCSRTTS